MYYNDDVIALNALDFYNYYSTGKNIDLVKEVTNISDFKNRREFHNIVKRINKLNPMQLIDFLYFFAASEEAHRTIYITEPFDYKDITDIEKELEKVENWYLNWYLYVDYDARTHFNRTEKFHLCDFSIEKAHNYFSSIKQEFITMSEKELKKLAKARNKEKPIDLLN